MREIEELLKGGHPNSLGNTIEVVEKILDQNELFDELFNCYFSDNQVIKLRTSNAMKRTCKAKKDILIPYIDRFLHDISKVDQASAQWTLSQLFLMLEKDMNEIQISQAKDIMKENLSHHDDWIVLTQTMNTLVNWSKKDLELKKWLRPNLERLTGDERKSVSGRASKMLILIEK